MEMKMGALVQPSTPRPLPKKEDTYREVLNQIDVQHYCQPQTMMLPNSSLLAALLEHLTITHDECCHKIQPKLTTTSYGTIIASPLHQDAHMEEHQDEEDDHMETA